MNLLALVLILVILLFIYVKINFKTVESQNKFMKVICRLSLSKENQMLILRIMEKYYLCCSNQNGVEIIENLDESKVLEYMNMKKTTLSKKG